MNQKASYLSDRKLKLESFIAFHQNNLNLNFKGKLPRLFFFPVPPEIEFVNENLYLVNNDLYKEDYGTFKILINNLKTLCLTADIAQADFVVLALNLYFHSELSAYKLRELVAEIRKSAPGKQLILFSIGDFCLKSVNRSTTFERALLKSLPTTKDLVIEFVQPSDIFIHFESTIDFYFSDIAIFPLIEILPISPYLSKKEFLFSFVGEFYKEGWPAGFIRSPDNSTVWERLAERNIQNSLLLSADQVITKHESNPFIDIPRRSTFTLCPRGITSWSFRLFEAILSGSIPVILSDSYIKPFSSIIPWDSFTLTYPEHTLNQIDAILENIQPHIIENLMVNVHKNQHWFTASGLIRLVCEALTEKLLSKSGDL
ncbi:exostosin family protein [Mucilaginibacter sp. RCC_168]|uniref:exostosin domain-containing protein n=1 Tax=Mucilaginibacter sp. RCC_168 TaxID=3239221 RepID=UPI0035231651